MDSATSTIPLASQVGGHAGVLTSEDGSLVIKPALPLEHIFYQSLTSDTAFAGLRPYTPKFYGTLKLEGKTTEGEFGVELAEVADPSVQKDEQSLVLENLSHLFSKPNILDIKLGTVLYDEDASEEKKQRMIQTASETTSLETGVRLTGFQVYDNSTGEPINTPKSYGKSIKVADLPDGIERFFPISSAASTSGLPLKLLLPIIKAFREDVAEIREAFAGVELRMVGGSILLVYEGDAVKAEEGINWMLEGDNDEEEEDEAEADDDDEVKKPGFPYTVKLIDFAHTVVVPGQGPDEGVLKGFDTVLSLLDGRIAQLEG